MNSYGNLKNAVPRATGFSLLLVALCIVLVPAYANASGWLSTSGAQILDPNGNQWLGHGVNLPDMRSNSACSSAQNKDDPTQAQARLDIVASWGANFIRIPMESTDAVANNSSQSDIITDPNYLKGLKAIVDHASSNYPNMYILLSVWIDPTLSSGGYPTTAEDAALNALVDTFYSYSNVMFGVSNEPQLVDEGTIWSAMNHAVQTIRTREASYGSARHLVAVQGREWTDDVSYYINHPITAGSGVNIIYEMHIYDNDLTSNVFDVSASLPVFLGEYGPADNNNSGYDWEASCGNPPNGDNFTLSQIATFVTNLRANSIPYLAWSFNECDPPNLVSVRSPGYAGGCNKGTNIILDNTSWGNQVYTDLQLAYGSGNSGGGGGTTPPTTTLTTAQIVTAILSL